MRVLPHITTGSTACSALATIITPKPLSLALACDAALSQLLELSDAVRECTAPVRKEVPTVSTGALSCVCRIAWGTAWVWLYN